MEPIFAFDTVYTENTLKKANKAVFGKGIALVRIFFAAMAGILLYQGVKLIQLFPRAVYMGSGAYFMALMICCVLFSARLIYRAVRWPSILVKRSLRRTSAFTLCRHETLFFEDGYESRSERQVTKLRYGGITLALETETGFYLTSDGLTVILPKTDASKGTADEFRAFLKGKIPAGARCNF